LKSLLHALLWLTLAGISGCVTKSAPAPKVHFRVMTYNIHHGEGLDGKVDLVRIAELIKRERADIVALQEVDKGVARTQQRDIAGELAKLTGMTGVFSNNFHYQGGEYGNAVLTRFPVLTTRNTHYQMLRTNEQRGLLELTLNVKGRELGFLDTHLDFRHDDAERLLNLIKIREVVNAHAGQPVILCGDFNDAPTSRTYSRLKLFLNDAWSMVGQGTGWTFSADHLQRRIDYVWFSPSESLRPVRAWVPASNASDHLPLVVELELR
jgi:endonuclease/exonuclease/phosphatase family metal-dependent hydrolase